jgi:hypothetical protein
MKNQQNNCLLTYLSLQEIVMAERISLYKADAGPTKPSSNKSKR